MFTVFGANGFVGEAVCRMLEESGQTVARPARGTDPASLGEMGHVLYCAGVTADFRSRPFDTMEAHVALPARILAAGRFASFLYLSSTRVYDGAGAGEETAPITVDPADPSDLYNLSKLSGEALCLNRPEPAVRIARLSNVYGTRMFADAAGGANFLADVIGEAVSRGRIALRTHRSSAKDYIDVADVARALVLIAVDGDERVYNVAAGRNASHGEVVDRLSALTGCRIDAPAGAPVVDYPEISTRRLAGLFARSGAEWAPAPLSDRLDALVAAARKTRRSTEGAIA